jgi:hypothetical protein
MRTFRRTPAAVPQSSRNFAPRWMILVPAAAAAELPGFPMQVTSTRMTSLNAVFLSTSYRNSPFPGTRALSGMAGARFIAVNSGPIKRTSKFLIAA